ncbi:MAG: putative porin [Verrucomicrobiota bacterium]
MKRLWLIFGLLLCSVLLARADEDALLKLLVRKKIITEKEATAVKSELAEEKKSAGSAASSAKSGDATAQPGRADERRGPELVEKSGSKFKLSTPITELELYGDARLRFEVRQGETLGGDTQQRVRERYRIRLGLRGTLTDDWSFGLRLETGTSPRSSNVTFGDDTTTTSGGTTTTNGPFAKNNDGIFVGQAYLNYRGLKDVTLTGGKMANPFISTSMVWDPDINPEGLAEQWKHTFVLGGQPAAAAATDGKDGKAVAAAKSKASPMKLDLFVNLGQFVYDDTNPENPVGPSPRGVPRADAFMLGWQIGARFTFPNQVYAQAAPALYNYTGNGDTFNQHFVGESGENQTGINSLLVFDLPAEIGWKLGDIPMRFFADFAVNLNGNERATAAGHPDKTDQKYAFQVGLGVGQLKAKGDWQVNVFYQRADQFALDPNLVDTEFFDSKLNLQGIGVTAGYMLSNAVSVNLLYAYATHAESGLGTGGLGDIAISPLTNYQLFQADLNLKW